MSNNSGKKTTPNNATAILIRAFANRCELCSNLLSFEHKICPLFQKCIEFYFYSVTDGEVEDLRKWNP